MKKLLLLLMGVLVATGARAALGGNGYYRVNNYASGRYIYVEDNKGFVDQTAMTADMGAIQLWLDSDKKLSDPSTVIYVENISGRQYDFKSQGTGVHQIIDFYVSILENPAGSAKYLFYASSNGVAKYLCDSEMNLDEDKGCLADNLSGNWRIWQMTPISSSSSNYFGVSPEKKVGNTNYATFYASFPFSFASSGMEAYTISKVENGMAVLKKISGVVPASTPVLIKCASASPSGNKLNLGGSASAISGNLLKGVYFNNSSRSHKNQTAYDANTMRVLGTMADGSLGFVTSTEKFLAKNRAYLTVPSGSPAQIKIVTEEEYNNSFVTIGVKAADSAHGTVYVNKEGTTSVKVAKGTNVTLQATPKSPYVFSSWTLNGSQVSTSASYSVKAQSNATYTANFKLPEYVVTLSATNGAVEVTAGSTNVVSGKSYAHGTQITVKKVTPNDGYEFTSLKVGSNDVTSEFKSKGSYTFTLTAATTVTATFTAIPKYAVTLSANNGKVTVKAGDQTVTSGNTYRRGTVLTVSSVIPDDGYEFTSLKVGSKDVTSEFNSKGSYSFTLTEATTVTATFTAIPKYLVTLSATHGKINMKAADQTVVSGSSYRRGTAMSITSLIPDDGYELTALTLNSTDILSKYLKKEKYDFTLTENVTVKAEFTKIPEYTLSLKSEHGAIIVENAAGKRVGDGDIMRRDTELVIKQLTVEDGWRIVGMTLNSVQILGAFNNSPDGYPFTLTEDTEIEVEYVELTPDPEPRVHFSVEGDGNITVSLNNAPHPRLVTPIDNGGLVPYSPDGTTVYIYIEPRRNRILGGLVINGQSYTELGLVSNTSYGYIASCTVYDDDVNISVRFVDDPVSIDTVYGDSDCDSDVEYYNLDGVRIPADNLLPGIYIRRAGDEVTKILIR